MATPYGYNDVISKYARTQSPDRRSKEQADKIAQDVERFLDSGGEIQQIPNGASGYTHGKQIVINGHKRDVTSLLKRKLT